MGDKKVRIDKWLWSVRIFKSRTMASNACRSGKVKIGEKIIKPSTPIEVDQIISVRKNGFEFLFKSVKLISKRVSATLAQPCYEDLTPPEELNKYKDWYVGKANSEKRAKGLGRPTKRERRDIDGWKNVQVEDWFNFEDDDEEF